MNLDKSENCHNCYALEVEFNEDNHCHDFCCFLSQRKIIDEHDYEIFKKNGHKKIPPPSWCQRNKE